MVKQSLEKQPTSKRDITSNSRLHWRKSPLHSANDSGKSPGNPVVEMATPNGTKQSNRGNEKKRIEGQREVESQVG